MSGSKRLPLLESLLTSFLASMFIFSALALFLSEFQRSGTDEGKIVPRQQQAEIKSAFDYYLLQEIVDGQSVDSVRREYNAVTGDIRRFKLIEEFLSPECFGHFLKHSTGDRVQSSAMKKVTPAQSLHFADWSTSSRPSYPKIKLVNIPTSRIKRYREPSTPEGVILVFVGLNILIFFALVSRRSDGRSHRSPPPVRG